MTEKQVKRLDRVCECLHTGWDHIKDGGYPFPDGRGRCHGKDGANSPCDCARFVLADVRALFAAPSEERKP
jgi:hypothetical protein